MRVGHSRPVLCEQEVGPDDGPFLATNLRGTFLPTSRSLDGVARFAFTECPVGEEDRLLSELYDVLWKASVQQDWSNRCISLGQARERMVSLGLEPRTFIVSLSFLKDLSTEDADKLMQFQGYVTEVEGIRILASTLPPGRAILVATPIQAGLYVRSGDYVGLLVYHANRSLILVNSPSTTPS